MSRSHRPLAWSLVLALLCAVVATAQPTPTTHAAGLTCPAGETCIVVTSAQDPFNDTYPPDPGASPDYICGQGTTDGCTLREAITLANAKAAGTKTRIQFSVPRNTAGYATRIYFNNTIESWTIKLTAPLPAITHDDTIIDGFSQEEFTSGTSNNFGPTIIIDGGPLTSGTAQFPPQGTGGLLLRASNSTIQGLGVINFKTRTSTGNTLLGIGIEIDQNTGVAPPNLATNNVVRGCYIGVDEIGQNSAPNSYGMWIHTNGNTIGGNNSLASQDPNIISGNSNDGILLTGGTNKVRGNYIGLNRDGNVAIGNGESGVNMRSSGGNTIGTTSDAANSTFGNIISGNAQNGIYLTNGANNTIDGNLIGTDATGGIAIPNGADGIRIESSTDDTKGNKIGEKNYFTRNIISGNTKAGIRLTGLKTTDNAILNNYIGPSAGGVALGGDTNNTNGVIVENGADRNTIGGPLLGDFLVLADDNEANLISGNLSDAVVISGTVSQDNKVIGNTIGLDESRGFLFGNGGRGVVVLSGAQKTTIGGAGSSGNIISDNGGAAIYIAEPVAAVIDVTIAGNIIGLRRDNQAQPYNAATPIVKAAGNGGDGIFIDGADKVRVGGSAAEGNIIAANQGSGIQSLNTSTTTIQNNLIGTTKSGELNLDRGNTGDGIRATGTLTATTNTVLYNDGNGVWATGGAKSPLSGNTVSFNGGNGFLIDGAASQVTISGSTIYTNTLDGVHVQGGATNPQRVKIVDNSMQGNRKGIELNPETSGLPGVPDNPNHDIDPPIQVHINQSGVLTGKVYTGGNAACAGCTIQIFMANPDTRDGQGRDKLNVSPVVAADGTFAANLGIIPAQLALTATDQNGNTSEFTTLSRSFGLSIEPIEQAKNADPGQVISYTHQLVNNGTVDFTNVQLSANSSLGWGAQLKPDNPVAVAAGQSVPITLTLTLPTGPAANVREGVFDQTTIKASAISLNPAVTTTAVATDTTTVNGKFVLDVKPRGRNGFGSPKAPNVDYTHTLTNIGNQPGTITLSALSTLGWTTSVTPTLITLKPGESAGITNRVVVPPSTLEGTVEKTEVTIGGSWTEVFTNTTTVQIDPLATMEEDQEGEAAACTPISFTHTVTNLSNGTTTFRLIGSSSLGSSIKFTSKTADITLNPDNSFTVNLSDKSVFTFSAEITVKCTALKGQTDQVTLGLTDLNDNVIGGASVTDTIFVTQNAYVPRAYLPVIFQ